MTVDIESGSRSGAAPAELLVEAVVSRAAEWDCLGASILGLSEVDIQTIATYVSGTIEDPESPLPLIDYLLLTGGAGVLDGTTEMSLEE